MTEIQPIVVADVRCSDTDLTVSLADGRTISVPLAWYPRLLKAAPEQRANWRACAGGSGIHWPMVDEDVSVEAMLRGDRAAVPAPT